jgi:hypothetical protein
MRRYTPKEGSLPWKVLQFFVVNPDEELDADLIAAKFNYSRSSIHTLLRDAVQAGVLRRVEDREAGELLYSLGAPAWPTDAPTAPSPATVHTLKVSKRAAPFRIDLALVEIEKNVPMWPRRSGMNWTPVFDRLDVGDSFVLPVEAKSAVGSAASRYTKTTGKKLIRRAVTDGLRVWRVA